jgi:hypothetical protein
MTIGGISAIVLVLKIAVLSTDRISTLYFVGIKDIYIEEDKWIRRRWTEEAMLSCDDARIVH